MQRSLKRVRIGCSGLRVLLGVLVAVWVVAPVGARELAAVVAVDLASLAPETARLELSVDGEAAEVLSIEPLAPAPGGLAWEVLLYFDTPLSTPEGLARSIAALRARAETLVALGPVSIVVADPEPREVLVGADRAHLVRESLDLLADRATLAGELVWRRLRFLESTAPEAPPAERRDALLHEQRLLERQRGGLERRLRARPRSGPGLLILVQDGFDLDFKRFYLSRTRDLESLDSPLDEEHRRLAREAAAAGWTTIPLALGSLGSELTDPRRPLRALVAATGGELVTNDERLSPLLESLSDRVLVRFRARVGAEPVELEARLSGRPLRATRWVDDGNGATVLAAASSAGEAPSGVIRLLSPTPAGKDSMRVTAVTGGHQVGYVAFFLDGFLVDVARQAPYSVRIDEPGDLAVVRAVAFSPDALELGEDSLELDASDRPFRVEIAAVHGEPARGAVELDATVSTPAGRALRRVEFFWNDELRESLEPARSEERWSVRLETSPPGPADHYRVVAHLDDGSSLETARLAAEQRAADRLDVNLVEIYATVTDRRDGPMGELGRDDFTLLHGGRAHSVTGFARAEELPLTLGLAVDTSQSMAVWEDDMRDAAAAFFETAIGDRDRAFLVDFAARPRLAQPPTGRRDLLVGRMGALDFDGYTSLYDALLFSLMQFEALGGRKALVVLSDGDDSRSRFRPERSIREARRLGVPIYMVVREDASRPLDARERMVLTRIAEQTGGRAHFFSSRPRLDEIYSAIEADLRSQYLLTYATERPLTAADLGDIRVEVRDPRLSVRTILGASVR